MGATGTQARYADEYTVGNWDTEEESAAALDQILERADLWRVYREVTGRLIQPRPGQGSTGVRIDRILFPTPKIVKLGWSYGPVGIEIKKSGVKIGRPISQAMDYTRSAFVLPTIELPLCLGWVFLWPADSIHGALASVCAQNRVGSASPTKDGGIRIKSGEELLFSEYRGRIKIGNAKSGKKTGSR